MKPFIIIAVILIILFAACGEKPNPLKVYGRARLADTIPDSILNKGAFRSDSCALELPHISTLTLSPVRLVARLEGDTLEIIPNEIMYVKIAGTIYQVEHAGKWMRMVYYEGDCDGRNRMKHAVNAADLKCDPYYKAFEPDTCCFCDDSPRACVVIGTIYHNGGNFIDLGSKKKTLPKRIKPKKKPAEIDIKQYDTIWPPQDDDYIYGTYIPSFPSSTADPIDGRPFLDSIGIYHLRHCYKDSIPRN